MQLITLHLQSGSRESSPVNQCVFVVGVRPPWNGTTYQPYSDWVLPHQTNLSGNASAYVLGGLSPMCFYMAIIMNYSNCTLLTQLGTCYSTPYNIFASLELPVSALGSPHFNMSQISTLLDST